MSARDSALDAGALARIRGLLKPPEAPERVWPALAAAAFCAVAALSLAAAMIVAPPTQTSHLPSERLRR